MAKGLKSRNPWWLYLSTLITCLIAIGLLIQELYVAFVPLAGLAVWQFQRILSRSLDQYNRTVEQENKKLQHNVDAPLALAPDTTGEFRDLAVDLWDRAIWLARNFRMIWPGPDRDKQQVHGYLERLEDFDGYLVKESIRLPTKIEVPARQMYNAIQEYRVGKEARWTEPYDPETSREGGKLMSSGAKNLRTAFDDLRTAIKIEFGVE